jgi:hypothetical protein
VNGAKTEPKSLIPKLSVTHRRTNQRGGSAG